MNTGWISVTRKRPCQFCGKADWCSYSADGRVTVCMRTESDKSTRNGGWLHRLTNDRIPLQRPVPCKPRLRVQRDWAAMAAKYHKAMTEKAWEILSGDLGLSIETLKAMQVGWDGSQSRYTFPMRNHLGNAIGIRTREKDGKRSVSGTDGNGLFFVPSMLQSDYLIVCEGPTDLAALVDAGFRSSVGKPSCKQGDCYVVEIIRRLQPAAVLLLPDSDVVGLEGFSNLANEILNKGVMPFSRIDSLTPPTPLNDVRQWLQKNRDHLGGRIAAKLQAIKLRSGGSPND